MPPKTAKIRDGAIDPERMRELGRRGAAKVDREPGSGRFRRREAPAPPDPMPPAPPVDHPAPPADPPIRTQRGILERWLRR